MIELFRLSFMQNALLASVMIAILCPLIGIFLVLKRHSMVGDALSHASFAGVAIGIFIGVNPMITTFIFVTICAVLIELLRNSFKQYSDLILPIILTLSVGIAITLTTSGRASGNIESFLFGSILTVGKSDLVLILIISVVSIFLIAIFYNNFLYTTFDEQGARVSGINTKFLNYIFSIVVGFVISVSIRITGILVVSSLLAVPVAAAMQFKKGFKSTLILSILFSFIDVLVGLFSSYYLNCAPGGTVALTSVLTLIISIIIRRGSGME
ncbi:zinc transport system permease protein [Clostridium acetobutylicum]|uniref:ABC-type iron (III) transport system, permease component n=1 Tax=Clostridium acetobutylicum (strain ATCC 824 / DSM 792 / JCM 1419 / IAM 19013 / LMG 5710 / NBRC 13948 / NRRL B-527 / VKM B-1787 / 2291 / W) TaxID=272562 RepID=Q97F74_CLOAB|nr:MULTISPECIES: metal ABC transporter permease [Clostridium]AAK80821.1 ABC-type iron (III) transport system, permease component [Clostridium acetobutylicum ATCC 824]ADZ21922.1 ABC-type iron (III) transport system, permease component [Clostridium acetobutylicum EA 2018]AEI33176.1 ABC-type iron (III) transport system, permease component [Clostridium acetobutylicum DSM 1731]AWV78767.1 metal ABC transporter permease [Clostridium acetobutylicum]MBC2393631.1 metal ABC transporter permease [Clostrid